MGLAQSFPQSCTHRYSSLSWVKIVGTETIEGSNYGMRIVQERKAGRVWRRDQHPLPRPEGP